MSIRRPSITFQPRPRVFIDMDGVVADFDGYMADHGFTADQVKSLPGAYLAMRPMPGAIEAIGELQSLGYSVFLATKPPTGVPHACSDKVAWVLEHLPALARSVIITHDKGLLGSCADYLIDDRPWRANCQTFPGTLITFAEGFFWPQVLEFLRGEATWRACDSNEAAAAALG